MDIATISIPSENLEMLWFCVYHVSTTVYLVEITFSITSHMNFNSVQGNRWFCFSFYFSPIIIEIFTSFFHTFDDPKLIFEYWYRLLNSNWTQTKRKKYYVGQKKNTSEEKKKKKEDQLGNQRNTLIKKGNLQTLTIDVADQCQCKNATRKYYHRGHLFVCFVFRIVAFKTTTTNCILTLFFYCCFCCCCFHRNCQPKLFMKLW